MTMRGLAVGCMACGVPIVISRIALGCGLREIGEDIEKQGATVGAPNPLTGYCPLYCAACSGERVTVVEVIKHTDTVDEKKSQ